METWWLTKRAPDYWRGLAGQVDPEPGFPAALSELRFAKYGSACLRERSLTVAARIGCAIALNRATRRQPFYNTSHAHREDLRSRAGPAPSFLDLLRADRHRQRDRHRCERRGHRRRAACDLEP